ncbi:hypothetical protein NLI96_g1466 [Meripilus lineatus]|uniref:Cerato-platanin n=1 Tax=Meripilus lineatus TaxID=2056292 RepID=A0AAD5VFW9_9APHY|nr:hypothetical protein NLI96_g1466 [Physisporinus lineatus]
MLPTIILIVFMFLFPPSLAASPPSSPINLTSSPYYDDKQFPLSKLGRCSDVLVGKDRKVLGDLKNFPKVGLAYFVHGPQTDCGSCWRLSYKNDSIDVLALDNAGDGFVLSEEALKMLTGTTTGRFSAMIQQVPTGSSLSRWFLPERSG